MNCLNFAIGHAFTLLLVVGALADTPKSESETVSIPLDQIWAYRMPGTRDILKLESGAIGKRLWDAIVTTLLADVSPEWPREGQIARPGFAVVGAGLAALRGTDAVMVKREKPRDVFAADEEISLVYFSYQCEYLIELRKVERRDNEIQIQYRFVAPIDKILPAHLALIPLGKSPPGKYHVKVVQDAMGRHLLDGRYASLDPDPRLARMQDDAGRRFVSRSFLFNVVQDEQK